MMSAPVEKMEVDGEAVVDLSVGNPAPKPPSENGEAVQDLSKISDAAAMRPPASRVKDYEEQHHPRRNLRPRRERSYAESPDIIVLSDEEPRINGFVNGYESDSDDAEMPPLPPIKELSTEELAEKERLIRKLREELRNEEMKLVLLKKLKQSQQMKENIAVLPPTTQAPAVTKLTPSVTLTAKLPPPAQQAPQQQVPQALVRSSKQTPAPAALPPAHRGYGGSSSGRYDQGGQSRGQNLPPPLMGMGGRNNAAAMQQNLLMAQQSLLRGGTNLVGGRAPVNTPPNVVMGYPLGAAERAPKESHHSPSTQQERSRQEDNQTPAQRQAAAKLALRKQLEKTLLQIPPPKPPPPEMHFIPNPSNAEFIYLLGLEHVVDYITRDQKAPPPPDPFQCSQCETDFTPVWKWEKSSKSDHKRRQQLTMGHQTSGKELRVICEQCVTTNVKKALKAEHTNRLKTAFVKALQQEQEIEQRMAQGAESPAPAAPSPKPPTPLSHAPTPPTPSAAPPAPQPRQQQAATPPTRADRERERAEQALAAAAAQFPKFADPSKFAAALAAAASNPAAALQAAHQQLMRLPQHQAPLPAHMMPFSPLLYPYQLAMAQAAGGKGPVAAAAANLVELQRQAADLQRQYLLDMIPSNSMQQGRGGMNWKT
ncbi:transcriptional repressor p66-alpha isoform X2 [Neocloeon triangulifer]|uniref:transcriptional repressor p66-alpha isoform X2 n=1 Tax=Neocloeon triangulifer TaxID=2078957 RepID=UPI00286F985C|nr:transcriptional repressor p66-alpha isoform X2 [Neocloeon triangulifer]